MIKMQRRSCIPLLLAAAAMLAGSARAAEDVAPAADAATVASTAPESKVKVEVIALPGGAAEQRAIPAEVLSTPAMTSVRAVIDPETGRLRVPTREERQEWAESLKPFLSRSNKDLKMVVLDSGAEVIDLEGRFMSMTVAGVRPDGTFATECITRPTATTPISKEDRHDQ